MALSASERLKTDVGFHLPQVRFFPTYTKQQKFLVAQGFFRTAQSEVLPWSLVPPVENVALEVMLWGCK
jgi:hypothetical protein